MSLAAIMPKAKDERWKYTDLAGAVRRLDVKDVPAAARIRVEGASALVKATPNGLEIDVAAGHVAEAPLRIFIEGIDGHMAEPLLTVRVGENAQIEIIEIHTGDGRFINRATARITMSQNARVKHYRIQDYGAAGVYVQDTQITLARDALYEAFTLTTGAALSRNEIHARLEGPGAHCELNGVNLLAGMQLGDTTITVDHQAPNCTSHQFYRTVLDDQARGVFQGKIHVARAAQKTDGFQMSRALLLSEGAEMDTKPELEIYADDVKCSHGATTGQLDEEALFYMRSRGIGRDEARGLLIGAFIGEAVEKIEDEAVRVEFAERVAAWLAKR